MTKNQFRAVPIFLLLFLFVSLSVMHTAQTIIDITGASADSDGVVLVVFYAPWCEHSRALSPIWEKAATVLKGVATVAAVDADAHESLARDYGIMEFPTTKVFVPGKPPVIYNGARAVEPIADFALLERPVRVSLMERNKKDLS